MTISDKRLSLINVYGPNKNDPTFYVNVFKSITDIGNDLFMICGENIVNLIKKSKIETGYKVDHSIVTLLLAMDNFVHGKSLWKHNNSLLTDAEYLKTINSKIPVYNHDAIDEIPDEELQLVIND